MIHTIQMETMDLARECDDACGDLTEEQEQTARDLIDCVSGKWSMWVLYELAQEGGPLRFSRLSERVEGISQKVLTQTLRRLERDGLVSRTLYPQVPPRVEYELTKLGRKLLEQLLPLWRGWLSAFLTLRLRAANSMLRPKRHWPTRNRIQGDAFGANDDPA